jgi:hypothetical protein
MKGSEVEAQAALDQQVGVSRLGDPPGRVCAGGECGPAVAVPSPGGKAGGMVEGWDLGSPIANRLHVAPELQMISGWCSRLMRAGHGQVS